jgi:hypothetical protein
MSLRFSIAFMLSAAFLTLFMKSMARSNWLRTKPFETAAMAYAISLGCVLAVAAAAQFNGIIIGATEESHGFFGGPDYFTYIPLYESESDWVGLLLLLPLLLFVLSRWDSMQATRKFRWLLVLLFPFWLISAIICNSYFFDSQKPVYSDRGLTVPLKP